MKLRTGFPSSPRLNRPDTASIGLLELPSPAKCRVLSGSAMKLAAARSGVMPTNQAAVVSSVVPVLPPTGRPTALYTDGAVDQSPQLAPAAPAPYPVVQRVASTAARATSGFTTWLHCGVPPATGLPLRSKMPVTGFALQNLPSAARVAYAFAISNGVAPATPRVKAPQPAAFCGEANVRSRSVCQVRPSFSAIRTARS